jgi:hypothetical protein
LNLLKLVEKQDGAADVQTLFLSSSRQAHARAPDHARCLAQLLALRISVPPLNDDVLALDVTEGSQTAFECLEISEDSLGMRY